MYTIYTQNLCPYCTLAKRILQEQKQQFKEINISEDLEGKRFLRENGYKTVPQIFYNETDYIGDYEKLRKIYDKHNI